MKIVLDLTDDEIENLEEAVLADDCGPGQYGWTSETRDSLAAKVNEAIERSKEI